MLALTLPLPGFSWHLSPDCAIYDHLLSSPQNKIGFSSHWIYIKIHSQLYSSQGMMQSSEHYVKEHHKDMKRKNSSIKCLYINCMNIEGENCSQFCFFYKNCLTFKNN